MTDKRTASGRSLDPQFDEAREAFDMLNRAIRPLGFMLSGFNHVPDSGYPAFTVTLTSRQAELIEGALRPAEDGEEDSQQMQNTVDEVLRAANGDTNDDEIDALHSALELALARWPGVVYER